MASNKGGKPRTNEYTDDQERVATFRITHGKLTDFQAECDRRGLSMSEALHGYIDQVLSGEGELIKPVSDIDRRFSEMEARITALMEEMEVVKKLELSA